MSKIQSFVFLKAGSLSIDPKNLRVQFHCIYYLVHLIFDAYVDRILIDLAKHLASIEIPLSQHHSESPSKILYLLSSNIDILTVKVSECVALKLPKEFKQGKFLCVAALQG